MVSSENPPTTAAARSAALPVLRRSVFSVYWPFLMLGLLLPVYGREIGADVVQIGLLYSAFSVMTVLLRPVVGRALDRFGRRPFLLFGLAADLGTAIGPLAGAWLYQRAGEAIPFYANGVVLLIAAAVLAIFLRVPRASRAGAGPAPPGPDREVVPQ